MDFLTNKIKLLRHILLEKITLLTYLPELFSRKGHIYISFAIPRFIKSNYNWGDDVNFVLGEKLSGKKVIPNRYSWFKHTNYLVIGSVVQWYTNSKSIIWGAGLLHPVTELEKPKQVLAVRGPLTRNSLLECGIDCPEVYGDPALLFPLLYKPKITKTHKLGVIRHFTEQNIDLKIPENINSDEVLMIDICKYGDWTNFIDQILSCETILSSSLHGLIISEAYYIPNLWVSFKKTNKPHACFKYEDFYLSVGKENVKKPFDYQTELESNDEMINFIHQTWIKPNINLEPLIESCPFDIKKYL